MASTHGTSNPSAEARAESSTTSRRRALGLAAASISVLLQRPQPTWAKPALLDLPACSNFKQAGPLQICELAVGAGDAPEAGDLVVVDYTARAVATGSVYDGSRGFKFTVGNGEVIPGFDLGILGDESQGVPPIRQGGSRTLLIPPELAYGAAGDGCLFGRGENCRIPPGSSVEITFRYRGLGY